MVILNDSRNKYDSDARAYLTERFSQSARQLNSCHMTRISPKAGSSIPGTNCRRRPACGYSRSLRRWRTNTFRMPTGRANGEGLVPGALRGCGGMWRTPCLAGISGVGAGRGLHRQHRRAAQRGTQTPGLGRTGIRGRLRTAQGQRRAARCHQDAGRTRRRGRCHARAGARGRRANRSSRSTSRCPPAWPGSARNCSSQSPPRPPRTRRWPSWRWSAADGAGIGCAQPHRHRLVGAQRS